MADTPSFFARLFGQRPTSADASIAPAPATPRPAASAASATADGERPGTLALVIPPDHITLTLLRAHVRKWDWMARSQDSLRVASGDMSVFDFALAQRQRNARQRLIERADRGEVITEHDLIDVMGADFNLGATEVAMILDADRDVRRSQERAEDRARWQRAVDSHDQAKRGPRDRGTDDGDARQQGAKSPPQPPAPGTEPSFDARLRADDVDSLIVAAAGSDDTASLTEWLNDDAAGLLRSLRADATLAHADARGEVVYEATVCAWARTTVQGGQVIRGDLPSAVLRWLADDEALRTAGGDQDALEAYFTDATRESEALHRAAWIDAITSTDGRAAAGALPPIKGVTTAANVGTPALRAGEFKRLDPSDAAASIFQVISARRKADAPGRVRATDLPEHGPETRDAGDDGEIYPGAARVGPAFDGAPMDDSGTWDTYDVEDDLRIADDDVPSTPAPVPQRSEPSKPRLSFDADVLWTELPRPSARVAPTPVNPQPAPPSITDDLAGLPQSADEAPGPAVWIRGRRVDGSFVRVHDDVVSIEINGVVRELAGPIHREGAPAVVEPDGTKRYYVHGALSRPDGPAIEAADPAHDVYAVDGTVKPLDLPPALLRDRAFRARLFRAWERAGFPLNAEVQARALLAIMPLEEREPFLSVVRNSTDQHDLRFAASADALYGAPAPVVPQPAPDPVASTPVPPIPPLPASIELRDDLEDFYDSLIHDTPSPG